MNKDRIFGLFSDSSSDVKITEEQKRQIIALNSGPYNKLGMFTKLILNHFVFHDKLQKFLQSTLKHYLMI